jgi:hypothetical protein
LTIEGLRSLKLFEMGLLSKEEQIAAIDRLKNLFEPADAQTEDVPVTA